MRIKGSAAAVVGVMALGLLTALPVGAEAPYRFDTTPGKLPKTMLPRAYRIDLRPDLAAARFTANEEIDVNVAQATSNVILNAVDLTFQSVELADQPGTVAQVSIDRKAETATLRFPQPLSVGMHTLRIAYAGPITPEPSGLYYNDYDTARGKRRMLVTQFEATDARRMFPSWDEPAFKATFRLSVVVPAKHTAISNMPVLQEEPAGRDGQGRARKKVTFATTPSMSTYLVALLAGDLEAVRGKATGVDLAVWAVRGKASQGRTALGDARELLPYFNDYFGVDYPLPKLDMIAIPGNFDAGAMENWGAITYIDDSLLFDPNDSSEDTRQDIFETIAHEMAHQWSGDLVTMAWWDNIWLNEGFAAWMENKATDHLKPDWQVWLRSHAEKQRAMASDARSTTHAIQSRVDNESDVKTLFDDITYLKGAQFIRMIETYLGEDAFRRGMRNYIKKHAYSNATTADLWAELQSASGRPVGAIAATFTEQPGVPLVRVATRCSEGRTQLELSQERFTVHDPQALPLTWQIPVIVGTIGANLAPRTVLVGAQSVPLEFDGCETPVKVNLGDVGYYRVAYDARGLALLEGSFGKLSAADRVNLLSDQWALVEAGKGSARPYLALLSRLGDERELVVWNDVLAVIAQLDGFERGSPDQPAFRAWARGILRPVLARLGWTVRAGEPNGDLLLRGAVITQLGLLDDAEVLAASKARFDEFLAAPDSLAPSLRDAVIYNTGRQADQATFDRLHALGRRATGTEEKLRYYFAMARARDPKFTAPLSAVALRGAIAPARISYLLVAAAAYGPDPEAIWHQTVAMREALLAKITEDQRERLLPSLAGMTYSSGVAAELRDLSLPSATSGAAYEVDKAVERIQMRAELRTRMLAEIHDFLGLANTP